MLKKLGRFIYRLRITSLTIRLRLLGFLLGLIFLLLLFVIVILLMTGTLTSGQRELDEYFDIELERLSDEIERDYGQISASAVSLAENIAVSAEQFASQRGGALSDLQANPELLQELLDSNFDRLILSLEKARASGAFIILDATINQEIERADQSRAGLYIKNMEPNIVSASTPRMTVFRGFADLGRKRGYSLHSLWSMEFDLSMFPEYEMIKQQVKQNGKNNLTRLYVWGEARPTYGTNEQYMPCIVPLIDSEGNFFGVCGFEVSSLLFKLNYKPVNKEYQRINCLIAPIDERGLILTSALAGGDYNSFSAFINKAQAYGRPDENIESIDAGITGDLPAAWLKPVKERSRIIIYRFDGSDLPAGDSSGELRAGPGSFFAGRHTTLRLLPHDSIFTGRTFASVLIIGESEFSELLGRNNLKIAGLFVLFIVAGVLAAVFVSKRFVRPIIRGLEAAVAHDLDGLEDSNIAEIDALIEQLRVRYKDRTGQSLPDDLFEDFISRLETLTPTEKIITGFYMRGESTQEILGNLFISSSTLKTHSSHIYTKLNISSRDELQLYYHLISRGGRHEEMAKRTGIF